MKKLVKDIGLVETVGGLIGVKVVILKLLKIIILI